MPQTQEPAEARPSKENEIIANRRSNCHAARLGGPQLAPTATIRNMAKPKSRKSVVVSFQPGSEEGSVHDVRIQLGLHRMPMLHADVYARVKALLEGSGAANWSVPSVLYRIGTHRVKQRAERPATFHRVGHQCAEHGLFRRGGRLMGGASGDVRSASSPEEP